MSPFRMLYAFVDKASDLLADIFVKMHKGYKRSEGSKKRQEQGNHSRSSSQNTNDQERAEQARNYRGGENSTDSRSHEEVLGLKPGFSFDELREAYKRECQRLHPDKYTSKPKAFRDAIEQEMKRVVVAHQELKKRFNV